MTEVILRLVLFAALPVVLGAAIIMFDRSATGQVRRAEAFLIPLFLVGVGGGGVTEFIANFFIAEPAARSLGREPGSPFQLELGFANLAVGLLGAVAAERRDGFREATVILATVLGLGAAVAVFVDAVAIGNVATGDLLRSLGGVTTAAFLIWFLLALRRGERDDPPNIVLRSWMIPVRRGSVAAVAIAAAAFSISYPTGQAVLLGVMGVVAAAVAFWWIVSRAPSHRVQ